MNTCKATLSVFFSILAEAIPHRERLATLHAICLQISRHISQKYSWIHPVFTPLFVSSDKKFDDASVAQSLCGIALSQARTLLVYHKVISFSIIFPKLFLFFCVNAFWLMLFMGICSGTLCPLRFSGTIIIGIRFPSLRSAENVSGTLSIVYVNFRETSAISHCGGCDVWLFR